MTDLSKLSNAELAREMLITDEVFVLSDNANALLREAASRLQAPAVAEVEVKPLEWVKSHITSWNGDYHTTTTSYTVRCADENGWKWSGPGGFGYAHSPEGAQADAFADHVRYIRSALRTGGSE